MDKLSFEEALSKLEDIVIKLEKGQVPLEESYSIFAEGVKLSKYCENILGKTEKKVEVLVKVPDSKNLKREFSAGRA